MAGIDDILSGITGIANVMSNVAGANLQFAEADSARAHKEKLLERQAFEKNQQDTINQNISYLTEQNKETAADIEATYKDGLKYGVTLNEHVLLHDKFKTGSEMSVLLEDYGLSINDDLSVSMGIFDTEIDAIEKNQARLKVGNEVQNLLTGMINDFQKVEDMRKFIGTGLDELGQYDLEDISAFIGKVQKGDFSPGIVTPDAWSEEVFEGLDPALLQNPEGDFPYYNFEDLPSDRQEMWKDKFDSFSSKGAGSMIDSDDIISKTFFQDNPWAKEYIMDQSYLTRGNKILKDELALQSARSLSDKRKKMADADIFSWEDEGAKLTTGHKKIRAMDDLNDSRFGKKGDVDLNNAMGIAMTGSDVYTFTASEAQKPKVLGEYKSTMSQQVVNGMNWLTDNQLLSYDENGVAIISEASPIIGNLVGELKSAVTPEQQKVIHTAITRALYDELRVNENTPDNMKDSNFNIDLSKLKAMGFNLSNNIFDWDGIPNDNTEEWDAASLSRFGKIWRRIEQVSQVQVGYGNELDASNSYYQSGNRQVFDAAEDKFSNILGGDTSSMLPNAMPNDSTAVLNSLDKILSKDNDDDILNIIDQMGQ